MRMSRSRVWKGEEVSPRKPGREPHRGGQTHLDAGMEKNWEILHSVVGHYEVHKARSPRVFDLRGSGSPL